MVDQCKSCGHPLLDGAQFCGKCGAKVIPTKKSNRLTLIIIGAIVAILIIGFLLLELSDMTADSNTPNKGSKGVNDIELSTSNLSAGSVVEKAQELLADPALGSESTSSFTESEVAMNGRFDKVSQAYGDYYGQSNVLLILDSGTIDEGEDNPFSAVDYANVYLDEDYLYCAFYIEANPDMGIEYEFEEITFDSTNTSISAQSSHVFDEVIYEINFNGNVSEDTGGQQYFTGNCYIHSYMQDTPDDYADFSVDFTTVLEYEFNMTEPIDGSATTDNTFSTSVVDTWELTAHPWEWMPEVWTFTESYELYDTNGFLIGNWDQTDEDTLVLLYLDGTYAVTKMYLDDQIMILMDESDNAYRFVRQGTLPIDIGMTDALNSVWDYGEAYSSNTYSNLLASMPFGTMNVNIDGEYLSLPMGFIRFDDPTLNTGFTYCMYAYYEGELLINWDPALSEQFVESYIIID